jgi:osmoprotectant transport system substrate-binding protein
MRRFALLSFTLLLTSFGCSDSEPLRIGAKGFAEQRILAEMAARLLKDGGLPVEPVVQCGDTYACTRSLQEGEIDLLVDYTGTGFLFQGAEPVGRDEAIPRLQELYAAQGLTWFAPLGFDNGYRLVARGDRARAAGIGRISDLAQLADGLRVACPSEYLRRPLDGLQSLLSRYGLRLEGDPLVFDDPQERLDTLLDGRAQVAVLYATDGAILDPRLVLLEDDLAFFPPYEAAFVARQATVAKRPRIVAALERLEQALDLETMRTLNQAVQMEGNGPALVAAAFLAERGLLAGESARLRKAPDLVVAVDAEASLEVFESRALAAVRRAWPRRSVVIRPTADPVDEVVRGDARLALLGAESFFRDGVREERLEAVAVLGKRMLHLVCRSGAKEDLPLHIGIPPGITAGGHVAADVLSRLGRTPAAEGAPETLLGRVAGGELDCALLLADPGEAALAAALGSGALSLRPLPSHTGGPAAGLPYLRSARVAEGTYPGQAGSVESWGSQVLLAGPRRGKEALEATGGPATALPTSGRPVAPERVQALAAATDFHEAPDPVLPSAWGATLTQRAARGEGGLVPVLLNAFVLLFLGWLVYLVARKDDCA